MNLKHLQRISKVTRSTDFLVDMHIHTSYSSCARITLDETLNELMGKVNAITVTDHNYIHDYSEETIQALFDKYQISVLIPSVEISTTQGDILAYGISSPPTPYLDAHKVIEMIHSEGGIAVAAHPYGYLGVGDLIYELEIDAIEINGARPQFSNELAKGAAATLNLPLIGGSDSHIHTQVGKCVTRFSEPIKTIQDLIEQIKKGKCSPVFLW